MRRAAALCLFLLTALPCSAQVRVRLAYFPNITHSQALIGVAREDFKRALGPGARLETVAFNAGPSEIEALFAGQVDIGYIGPGPTINGWVQSKGRLLRVVAGAASGGASLVVRKDAGVGSWRDLSGKRVASPQLGNTQDLSLRHFLAINGLKPRQKGGTVEIVPVANPDILTLFRRKDLAAAWVPEPWATRLVQEGNGQVLFDERTLWPRRRFNTAHVIVSSRFLKEHPDLVKRFLAAHVSITLWMKAHSAEARELVNREIQRLTGKLLPPAVLNPAYSRLDLTYDPLGGSTNAFAAWAADAGYVRGGRPDLRGLWDLTLLNQVLSERHLPEMR
ncbi:MAG TPA: ABC transporter substrate-binding protein [Armatimonadota bacterium]|jgi:NitT/TauT family transport system substrate-binding protein